MKPTFLLWCGCENDAVKLADSPAGSLASLNVHSSPCNECNECGAQLDKQTITSWAELCQAQTSLFLYSWYTVVAH